MQPRVCVSVVKHKPHLERVGQTHEATRLNRFRAGRSWARASKRWAESITYEKRFAGARALVFLVPEAGPLMFMDGILATGVVFVEDTPTRRSDDFAFIGLRARRSIDLSTLRGSGPPHWWGSLFQLALSLPRTPYTPPCLPVSRSSWFDFFRWRKICTRCMMEIKPGQRSRLDVSGYTG